MIEREKKREMEVTPIKFCLLALAFVIFHGLLERFVYQSDGTGTILGTIVLTGAFVISAIRESRTCNFQTPTKNLQG